VENNPFGLSGSGRLTVGAQETSNCRGVLAHLCARGVLDRLAALRRLTRLYLSVFEICAALWSSSDSPISLRLNDHFDDPVHEFELLRRASSKESVDALSDVLRIFLSFEEQEDVRRDS
jgi:hypothetical protein